MPQSTPPSSPRSRQQASHVGTPYRPARIIGGLALIALIALAGVFWLSRHNYTLPTDTPSAPTVSPSGSPLPGPQATASPATGDDSDHTARVEVATVALHTLTDVANALATTPIATVADQFDQGNFTAVPKTLLDRLRLVDQYATGDMYRVALFDLYAVTNETYPATAPARLDPATLTPQRVYLDQTNGHAVVDLRAFGNDGAHYTFHLTRSPDGVWQVDVANLVHEVEVIYNLSRATTRPTQPASNPMPSPSAS